MVRQHLRVSLDGMEGLAMPNGMGEVEGRMVWRGGKGREGGREGVYYVMVIYVGGF